MSARIPTPKEVLLSLAKARDDAVEAVRQSIASVASALGLPEPPPEPIRASDLVEALPDLPAPSLTFSTRTTTKTTTKPQGPMVERIKTQATRTGAGVRFKIA